jgi:hypothetical protein
MTSGRRGDIVGAMKHALGVALLLAMSGCGGDGGGSGLSDSAVLSSLSADQVMSLCEEIAGGEREVDCGDFTVTVGIDPAECETAEPFPETCTATVGDARACFDAIDGLSDEEICTSESPPEECAEFLSEDCG